MIFKSGPPYTKYISFFTNQFSNLWATEWSCMHISYPMIFLYRNFQKYYVGTFLTLPSKIRCCSSFRNLLPKYLYSLGVEWMFPKIATFHSWILETFLWKFSYASTKCFARRSRGIVDAFLVWHSKHSCFVKISPN